MILHAIPALTVILNTVSAAWTGINCSKGSMVHVQVRFDWAIYLSLRIDRGRMMSIIGLLSSNESLNYWRIYCWRDDFFLLDEWLIVKGYLKKGTIFVLWWWNVLFFLIFFICFCDEYFWMLFIETDEWYTTVQKLKISIFLVI